MIPAWVINKLIKRALRVNLLGCRVDMECKYVVVDELGREVRWQEGSNMELCVPGSIKGRPLHRLEASVSWCKQFKNFLASPVEGVTVPLTSLDVAPLKHQPQQQVAPATKSAPVTPSVPAAARQHASALPSASAIATPTKSVAAAPALAGVAAAAPAPLEPAAAASPLLAGKPSGRSGSPSNGNSFAAFVAARQSSPARQEQQQLPQQQQQQQHGSIFTASRAVAAEPALPSTPTKSSRSASPIGATVPAAGSVVEQPVAAVAASAQTSSSSTTTSSSAASPPVPSFQLNPPSSEEPMSILLKSGRARSPPVKISLSTATSLLMEMPSRPPSPALGTSPAAGAAATSGDASSSSASTSRPSTSELAAPTPMYPSGSPRFLAPASRPGSPSASAVTWGQEYDVYAAVYESPYMHTPFDLDAYAMYDAPTAMPPPVTPQPMPASRRSPSPRGALGESVFCGPGRQPSMAGPAATPATDLLETAVQAARELNVPPSAAPQPQPLPQPTPSAAPAQPTHAAAAAAAKSSAAAEPAQAAPSTPPPSPGSASSFPASFNPFLKDSQLGSSQPKSANDWAGKTLFELSAGRHAHDDEDDEEEEEPADDEAALSHALATPAAPAEMAALLKQLGSALGRSVRLRYEGVDSSAEDLLELDRKVRWIRVAFLLLGLVRRDALNSRHVCVRGVPCRLVACKARGGALTRRTCGHLNLIYRK